MSERVACAEADDVCTEGAHDPAQAARVASHRRECRRCAERAGRLEAVKGAILGADGRLDDLTRARVGAAVQAALAAPPRRRAGAHWLILPALAAGALLLLWRQHDPAVATAPPLLRPYQADGRLLGGSFDRLEVPAGTRVRASLGGKARLTLVGPAEIQVTEVKDGRIALRLPVGTLLADFDGHAGGGLVIHSPGAVIEVVGTRFAVEAGPRGSRVSVAHGRVKVRPGDGAAVAVSGGESWATGDQALRALDAATSTLLEEHGAEATPARAGAEATPAPAARNPAPARPVAHPALRRVAAREPARPIASAPIEATDVAPPASPAEVPAAPPVAPPVLPAPPPAPQPTATALYDRAEAAMARRDERDSRRWLEEVIARFPADPLADTARYELAQRALGAGDHDSAARHLDRIIAGGREEALVEGARFLRCRTESAEARRCLEAFRSSYPRSPRDAEALAALIQIARQGEACADVKRLAGEYRRRYPRGSFSAPAARSEAACAER